MRMRISKIKSNQWTAALTVLLGMAVMALTLFVPPVLGSADNGELAAVIEGNGLYKLDHGEADEYFSYAAVKYGVNQYHTEAERIFTSRNVFLLLAKGLNYFFGADRAVFDIRFYSGLLCVFTLVGLYLLTEYVAGKFPAGGILTAAAAVLMFCDSSYMTWLSSFYEESVIYPSLLVMLACLLQMSEEYHKSTGLLILFFISAGLLVTVNNTTMLWGILVGGFCILMLFAERKHKCFPMFSSEKGRRYQVLVLIAAVVFLAVSIFFQAANGEVRPAWKYHSMVRGMMASSDNPEKTAEFFGIDDSYSLLENSSAYDRYPVIDFQNVLLQKDFYAKYNTGKTIIYYLTHADAFSRTLQSVVNQAYTIHPSTGGAYDRTAGRKAGAQTEFFRLYSDLKEQSVPRAIGFLLIVLVIYLLLNWKNRWSCTFFTYLTIYSVLLMAAIVIRSGASDAARQLFCYNVFFDMLIFFMVSQGLHGIASKCRRKKRGNMSILLCLMITLLFTGCQRQTVSQEAEEFALKKEYRTDQKAGEREEACFDFVTDKMMSQGGVYTRYLESGQQGELAAGHEILAESEGLMLRYAVQRKDEQLYQEVRGYITGILQQDGYLSYRVDQKGKPLAVNACVDDLRIIRGLCEGGDRELAMEYAAQLQRTNEKNGLLTDYYTASDKRTADTVTLCYGDLTAMEYAAQELEGWQELRENTQKLMLGGYLGDSFPFFHTRYEIKKQRYTSEDIFMTEALLTAYHLAEAGKCPQKTVDWIEAALNDGRIYGRYTVKGEVTDKTESTAIYALCILIGQQTGNQNIVKLARACMERYQIMEKVNEIYGAFGEKATLDAYSFDNLMALMALRTLGVEEEQTAVATKTEAETDTVLIAESAEKEILEPWLFACGKRADFIESTGFTPGQAERYRYVVTTDNEAVGQLKGKKRIFAVGTSDAPADWELSSLKTGQFAFTSGEYIQGVKRREDIFYVTDVGRGKVFGEMELVTGEKIPYSVVGGGYGYASYAEENDLSGVALSSALREFFGEAPQPGKLYVMIDRIYPFTNEEMLLRQGEDLHKNGIPYLLRVMPVYDNLAYPEFGRWAGRLSYLQTQGGAVVMHEPLDTGGTDAGEQKPEAKMLFAKSALEHRGVVLYPMEREPVAVNVETLRNITTKTRNFAAPAADMTIVLPVYETQEEWEEALAVLQDKWLTVADYRDGFEDRNLTYTDRQTKEDYLYREKPVASMRSFFDVGNKVLLTIVGIAVAIYLVLLLSSVKIYRNKFRQKEKEEDMK